MVLEQENQNNEQNIEIEQNTLAAQGNDELAQLQEQLSSLQESLLRSEADKENLRKRLAREMEESVKFAISNFAGDLLEVLENLYRAEEALAASSIKDNPNIQSFVQGVMMTKNSLIDVFAKHGIRRLYPVNEKFDPQLHQAISQVATEDHTPGMVVMVAQAGYELKGRLLRPAIVITAKEHAE